VQTSTTPGATTTLPTTPVTPTDTGTTTTNTTGGGGLGPSLARAARALGHAVTAVG
jgi:hypothetical protein